MSQDTRPPNIVGPLNIYGLLALAGIIGPIVFLMTNLTTTFTAHGYDLLRSSISSLAWSPMGWLQSIGFLTVGIFVEIFAAGLFFSIRAKRGFGIGIGLLVYLGFGMLLLGAFAEDLAGTPHTVEGIIHIIAAISVFTSFPFASLLIAASLRRDFYWQGLYIYTIVATCLAAAFVVCYLIFWLSKFWIGLLEQVLVANMVIWIEIMAIQLMRLSFRPDAQLKRPRIF